MTFLNINKVEQYFGAFPLRGDPVCSNRKIGVSKKHAVMELKKHMNRISVWRYAEKYFSLSYSGPGIRRNTDTTRSVL